MAWLNSRCFGRWSQHIKHVFWTVVSYSNLILHVFLHIFTWFLTTFSVVITYVIFPPINIIPTFTIISHPLLLFLLQQQCFSILGLSEKETSLKISRIVWTVNGDGNTLQRSAVCLGARFTIKVSIALDKKRTLLSPLLFQPIFLLPIPFLPHHLEPLEVQFYPTRELVLP